MGSPKINRGPRRKNGGCPPLLQGWCGRKRVPLRTGQRGPGDGVPWKGDRGLARSLQRSPTTLPTSIRRRLSAPLGGLVPRSEKGLLAAPDLSPACPVGGEGCREEAHTPG